MPRELTDAEVDVLLERFDQTDPALQRRIVAKFVSDRVELADAVEELRTNAERLLAGGLPHFDRRDFARAVQMACDCVLKKVAGGT